MCRLVSIVRSRHRHIWTPRFVVGLARLVALRRQADMRADRPGMDERCGWVDRRAVASALPLRDPWGGHSRRHTGSPRTVSSSILCRTANCSNDPRTLQQRLDDCGQLGNPATSSRTRPSYRKLLTTPTLNRIAQRAAQIGFDVSSLR